MLTTTLTKKHKEIIHIVYRFRFLHRKQIQTFINSNDYGYTNRLLKYLTDNKYLIRIHSTDIDKRTIPARFYIGINGIRFLKTQDNVHKKHFTKLYKERDKKDPFINRCLLVADTYLKLKDQAEPIEEFMAPNDFPYGTITNQLRPNFGIVKSLKTKKEYTICRFIEKGRPPFINPSVLRNYITFFKNKKDTKLLFICETNNLYFFTQKFVTEYIDQLNDEEDIKLPVFITSAEDLKQNGMIKKILKKVN